MATNKVISASASMTLAWDAVSGANKYTLQVSAYPDFSVLLVNDATLVSATKTFTDGGTTNTKRWWRWRYSSDGGTTWSTWREVANYWIRSTATNFSTPSKENWYLVSDDSTMTDIYLIDPFPLWSVVAEKVPRVRVRNRSGDLLSEYLTIKDRIELRMPDSAWLSNEAMREFIRFNLVLKTFFLVNFKNNGDENLVPHIWNVQFEDDPRFEMLAAGSYKLTSTFKFEEV